MINESFEDKKSYLLEVLKKIKDVFPMAKTIETKILEWKADEKMIDELISFFAKVFQKTKQTIQEKQEKQRKLSVNKIEKLAQEEENDSENLANNLIQNI